MTLEERIAAYLDGALDERAAAEVEAELLDPRAAELLGEELMLRQLLSELSPDEPPASLIADIERSLGVSSGLVARAKRSLEARRERRRRGFGEIALGAAKLAVAAPSGIASAQAVASSISSVGRTVGAAADLTRPSREGRSIWRRVATAWWRRRR
ncbi:MAG: hypothetical protein OEY14_00155 [Myxococcales bacterium]|nr:hypothetical protein [Myxococcales bacterium]